MLGISHAAAPNVAELLDYTVPFGRACACANHSTRCGKHPKHGIPASQRSPDAQASGCSGIFPLWFAQDADGFFKTSMASSFSISCLRSDLSSASSSRIRCCSWLGGVVCPDKESEAFSHVRSVSTHIPSSLATSLGCRPCSVTIRKAPALNASSYRRGNLLFCCFSSIIFCPLFLFSLRLFFVSVKSGMGARVFSHRHPACGSRAP